MKRKTNGLRIMLREKPLGQASELKTQRQRFNKSRKIWSMLKLRDWRTESPKTLLRRWRLLLETVWVILQVPMMGRMVKMRMMNRQSRASRAKLTNLAGWWAQSPKGTAAHAEISAGADEAWWIGTTGMGWCSRLHPWNRSEVQHIWIESSSGRATPNRWWRCSTCTDNIWRAYGVSWDCPRKIANAARDFLTRKSSYQARFGEATVENEHIRSLARCRARYIIFAESEACWTSKVCSLHIDSS